jgi:uracil-DNA glycosylase
MIEPDYGNSLEELYNKWKDCTACELGQRRKQVNGAFVFGEGTHHQELGGIMFVGEGPGAEEEKAGRPFIGPSGMLLRNILALMEIDNLYITNAVCCRACAQAYTSNGQPRFRKQRDGSRVPVIKDEAPSPAHVAACYQRLCGEIYHYDPRIIVALGLEAAKALSTIRLTSIKQARAEANKVMIPGRFSVPSRTAVKGSWERKVKGVITRPTEPFMVGYLLVVTYHPAYLSRVQKDFKPENPVELFHRDLTKAKRIYDRYMQVISSVEPAERELDVELIRSLL